LVGWEFYIIIFLSLPLMWWSDLMICVTIFKDWIGLTSIIFIFLISFIIIEFVGNWYFLFFLHFLSILLSRYHVSGHGFCCRGRRRLVTAEALVVPPVRGVVCWKGFLDLIIKLWLIFRSRHLVLWSLRTYGLRESG
jgi:hypothetical protein